LPAVAAVEFLGGEAVGTAVGAERSSRGAQLSPDAFEPIPLEEVQDHFRPETGERFTARSTSGQRQSTAKTTSGRRQVRGYRQEHVRPETGHCQDHFRPEIGERLQPGALPARER
jgi:hypothetical protein